MLSKRDLIGAAVVVVILGGLALYQAVDGRRPELQATSSASVTSATVKIISSASEFSPDGREIGQKTYSVEVATTPEEQQIGLSGRDSLSPGTGMLFPFTPTQITSFWMKDMKFPLDFVWIADNKIVGIEKNVPAPAAGTSPADLPTYFSPQPVDYVLELNANESANFQIGDEVIITELTTI